MTNSFSNDATGSETDRTDLTVPALRTFSRIAALWAMSESDAARILGLEEPEMRDMLGRGQPPRTSDLSDEVLIRISHIIGIYKALQTLLPEADAADRWIRKPNQAPLFGGRPALSLLLEDGDQGLLEVRQYLEAQLT